MADIYPIIEAALENHLSGVTGVPTIVWENTNYTPDINVEFLEVFNIPTIREPRTMGDMFQTYYQGVFRVDCMVPSDLGRGAASELAKKVIEAFEANTDISFGGKTVTIRYAMKNLGTKEGAFYRVPIDIGWYIYD